MPTLTLQVDDATAKDTWLDKNAPTTNRDAHIGLMWREHKTFVDLFRTALVQPDLSSIPSSATIDSFLMNYWLNADGTTFATASWTPEVFIMVQNWVETEATWNVHSTGNSWGLVGAQHATNDYDGVIGNIATGSDFLTTDLQHDKKTITLDPTECQKLIDGTLTYEGFKVGLAAGLNDMYSVYSSYESTYTDERPEFVITYTLAGGGFKPLRRRRR